MIPDVYGILFRGFDRDPKYALDSLVVSNCTFCSVSDLWDVISDMHGILLEYVNPFINQFQN